MTSEPLPMDQDPLRALTEVIEAHDLYLHRHGTVPASKATAHSILHALRNRGLVLSLDAARAQGRAEALDVALGRLTEDDLHYEYGYSAGGEPLDPELFVHYEHLRSALAAIKENQP
jgi:hypothetical protein